MVTGLPFRVFLANPFSRLAEHMDSLAWFQLANKHCFLFLTVLKPERDGRETLVILIVYVEFEADRD